MSITHVDEVTLDDFGILRYRDHWVALTPTEHTVMRLLLDGFGRVVTGEELARAVWPDDEPSPERRGVHVIVCRLRKRLKPLHVAIATIRGRGFMLHAVA